MQQLLSLERALSEFTNAYREFVDSPADPKLHMVQRDRFDLAHENTVKAISDLLKGLREYTFKPPFYHQAHVAAHPIPLLTTDSPILMAPPQLKPRKYRLKRRKSK